MASSKRRAKPRVDPSLNSAEGGPACEVGAIVLAAGEARRMGALKQLLPWDGKTIIEQVVDCVLDAGPSPTVVVVGHRAAEVSERLAGRPVKIVNNRNYREGISSSLICGLKALGDRCQGFMVVLGDQPTLRATTLRHLLNTFRQRPKIVVPVYQRREGHPVIFPARYVGEIMELTGDKGARSVIEAHREDVLAVQVDTDSVILDIDTEEDYRSLHSRRYTRTK